MLFWQYFSSLRLKFWSQEPLWRALSAQEESLLPSLAYDDAGRQPQLRNHVQERTGSSIVKPMFGCVH